jgi:hypothetical protein
MRKTLAIVAVLAASIFCATPSFAQHGHGFGHGPGVHGPAGPGRGPGRVVGHPVRPGGDFRGWAGRGYRPGYGFGYGMRGWRGFGTPGYVFGWHAWRGYWGPAGYWGPVFIVDFGWQSYWDGAGYVYWDPIEHCWVNQYGQIVGY